MKFEIFVNELVNHQHRVVVEANSEEEVNEVLDFADECRENTAEDYIHRIRQKLKVLEHDNEYSVDSEEVECDDFNEIKEEI